MGTLTAEVAGLTALGQFLDRGTVSGWVHRLGVDEEQAAIEHQRVLGYEVFAHESVFLTESGLRAEGRLPWHRYDLQDQGDGLGVSVLLYAWLLDRGQGDVFVQEHLGRWILPVAVALGRQASPLFADLAGFLRELVPTAPARLPEPGPLLDDPKTGLRRIARRLLTPALSGWYLSKHQIGVLGRSVGLPTGFGSRENMLESLLFAAVDHGRLGPLLTQLQTEADEWSTAYAKAPEWQGRLDLSRRALDRLVEHVPSTA